MVFDLLIALIVFLVLMNIVEVVIKTPVVANIIGLTLALIFDYHPLSDGKDYHKPDGVKDILVYEAPEELLVANIFGKKIKVFPMMINASAITFGNVIIVSRKYCSNSCVDIILRHEVVHVEQYTKYGSLYFFFLYIYWYIRNFIKYYKQYCEMYKDKKTCFSYLSQKAYEEVPFEVEAREKSKVR